MLYIGKIKTDSIRRLLRPAGEKEGLILYQKISFSYDKNGNKTNEVRHGGYWNEEGYTDANGGVITYKEPADEGGVMGIFRKILTGFCIPDSSMIRRWGSIICGQDIITR